MMLKSFDGPIQSFDRFMLVIKAHVHFNSGIVIVLAVAASDIETDEIDPKFFDKAQNRAARELDSPTQILEFDHGLLAHEVFDQR